MTYNLERMEYRVGLLLVVACAWVSVLCGCVACVSVCAVCAACVPECVVACVVCFLIYLFFTKTKQLYI